MHDFHSAPPVVVGIDGSPDASSAALWAVDEAASRDVPLKLVHVIHRADLLGDTAGSPGQGPDQLAAARAALSDACRAVEATPAKVRVETEVIWGNPLATLIGLSQSATMVCAGSVGIQHTCHHGGSTAAALAGSAQCPVAVIHRRQVRRHGFTGSEAGYIVAEVDQSPDNNDVLEWAMAEAKLRRAPLRVITSCEPQSPLKHRIDHWTRQYPDVAVEQVTVPGSVARYLADCLAEEAESIRLFVSGTRDRRSFAEPGGCSVLTVGGHR